VVEINGELQFVRQLIRRRQSDDCRWRQLACGGCGTLLDILKRKNSRAIAAKFGLQIHALNAFAAESAVPHQPLCQC
jgi:hypothetical protein